MGIFNKAKNFFGTESDGDIWEEITEPDHLEDIIRQSKQSPQLIYKHSHRCGTCLITKGNLEQAADEQLDGIEMHFLNVIRSRAASNHIADQLDVYHESPQAILIKNGEVLWHASHTAIDPDKILQHLN